MNGQPGLTVFIRAQTVLRNKPYGNPAQKSRLISIDFLRGLVMAALYPLCKWFAGVKVRRKDWWLSYL